MIMIIYCHGRSVETIYSLSYFVKNSSNECCSSAKSPQVKTTIRWYVKLVATYWIVGTDLSIEVGDVDMGIILQ